MEDQRIHCADRSREAVDDNGSCSIFGRDSFMERLWDQIAPLQHPSSWPPLTVLVHGLSGCGKTALVEEFGRRIKLHFSGTDSSSSSVVFISGKVDQFQRTVPYMAIIQALDGLGRLLVPEIEALLSEEVEEKMTAEDELRKTHMQALRRLLRHEGKSLTHLVPSLASFLTPNDAGAGLPSLKISKISGLQDDHVMTERMICLAIQSFMRLIVNIHPVVWFVDDLQWADSSSLRLLKNLVLDDQLSRLLLIFGFRDGLDSDNCPSPEGRSESDSSFIDGSISHAREFHRLLDSIPADRTLNMTLENLQLEFVISWLSYLFASPQDTVLELAQFLHSKTDGNPYFVLQYLELLQRKRFLTFNSRTQKWDCDWSDLIEPVETLVVSETVTEVLSLQIASLPVFAQQLLQVAACLGFYFEEPLLRNLFQTCDSLLFLEAEHEGNDSQYTNPLSDCNDKDVTKIYLQALSRVEKERLIRQTRDPNIYQFVHDRVQQTVYESIHSKERARLHLRIGKHIYEMEAERHIIVAATQLNRGSMLLVHEQERVKLIELNFRASAQATTGGGISLTANFLHKAVLLVQECDWTQNYDMILEIYTRLAEAESSRGRVFQSQQHIDVILSHAKNMDDTIRARYVRMQMLGAQRLFRQAIREARKLLSKLGEPIPFINPISFLIEYYRARRLVQSMSDDELNNLSSMNDYKKSWIAKIMCACCVYGLNSDSNFAGFMFMRLMRFTLQHGKCEATSFAYAGYGLMIAAMGQESDGFRFGDLALRQVEDRTSYTPVATLANSFLFHLQRPFACCLEPLLSAYRIGLETGEIYFGSIAVCSYSLLYIICGLPLGPFVSDMRNYGGQLRLFGQDLSLAYLLPMLQLALNLRGETTDPLTLTWEACKKEHIFSENLTLGDDSTANGVLHYAQVFNAYILGDLNLAKEAAKRASSAQLSGTHFSNLFHSFLDGLVSLALYRETKRLKYLKIAARIINRLKVLAEKRSVNSIGMLLLLQAEEASVSSLSQDTVLRAYNKAISQLSRGGFTHFAAIANERASEYARRGGDEFWEVHYLKRSYDLYQEWGAVVKTRALLSNCPCLTERTATLPDVVEISLRGREQFDAIQDKFEDSSREFQSSSFYTVRST